MSRYLEKLYEERDPYVLFSEIVKLYERVQQMKRLMKIEVGTGIEREPVLSACHRSVAAGVPGSPLP